MIATDEPEYLLTASGVLLTLGMDAYKEGNPRALDMIEWALQWAERRGYRRGAQFEAAFRPPLDAKACHREVDAVLEVLDADEFILRLADRINAERLKAAGRVH